MHNIFTLLYSLDGVPKKCPMFTESNSGIVSGLEVQLMCFKKLNCVVP